jgi:hypothetical protein
MTKSRAPLKFLNFDNVPAGARWSRGSITRCERCSYYVSKSINPDKTTAGKCFIDRPRQRYVSGQMICPKFIFEPDQTVDYGWESAWFGSYRVRPA